MHKTYRNGIDIEVAFASGAKRLTGTTAYSAEAEPTPILDRDVRVNSEPAHSNPIPTYEAASFSHQGSSEEASTGRSALIKQILRPLARSIFTALKPIARPIAFRTRAYLTAGMMREAEAIKSLIRQETKDVLSSLEAIQQSSVATMQEIRATRRATQAAIEHEVQRAHARLTQQLEAIEEYTSTILQRTVIRCSNDEVLVRTGLGYVLCSASDPALLVQLVETGELEPGTRKLIERFLLPGDVFVDVGANVGLHTLAAARAMQGRGKVIAFEPFEPTKILLEKTVWINGFSAIVTVHQAAVSDQAGTRELFLGRTSGHHSLFGSLIQDSASLRSVIVPTVRLCDVVDQTDAISLLKIDVEGAELDVLEGSKPNIQSNPDIALIVEFGPSHIRRRGYGLDNWLSAFTNLGLSYRAIDPSTGELQALRLEQLETTNSVNLFFSRSNSKAWAKVGANR